MNPLYKEALKDKDNSVVKNILKKSEKPLGYSLLSMVLWLFLLLHNTIDFQFVLLCLTAGGLTWYLWSWKRGLFTLILAIGFHLTEDDIHGTLMVFFLLTVLGTFIFSLGSVNAMGGVSHSGMGNSMMDDNMDSDFFGDSDSGDYGDSGGDE